MKNGPFRIVKISFGYSNKTVNESLVLDRKGKIIIILQEIRSC